MVIRIYTVCAALCLNLDNEIIFTDYGSGFYLRWLDRIYYFIEMTWCLKFDF